MADKLFPTDYTEVASPLATDYTPLFREWDDMYKIKTENLKGEKGDTGATWPQGIQWVKWNTGAQWPTGATWATWATGATWPKWDTGAKGDTWATGATWPQWPAGNNGADGKSFTPKGEYSAGTSYVANDVVSYLGSSWIALQSTTGNIPAEWAYWTLNAAKGADGTWSGDISGSGTANEIAYFTAEKVIDNLPVATYPSLAELSYVKWVTSAIQTQINLKVSATTKATGADVNAGTNDVKYVTAKAIEDSSYIKDTYVTDANVSFADITTNNASATKHWFLPKLDNTGTKYLRDDGTWQTISAGGTYWTAVPWSPTRTGNTTFTLTDTSNTNKYDLLISRGTVVKWTESSTVKQAMVVSATYATNTVTVTLVGDTMASIDSNSLKYWAVKAKEITFAYLPTVWTGTDIMGRWYAGEKTKVHGSIWYHWTAGTGSNTTYDVYKNASATVLAWVITIASGWTVSSDVSATSTSANAILEANEYLTANCASVASTTAPSYATIKVFVSPFNDIYLS